MTDQQDVSIKMYQVKRLGVLPSGSRCAGVLPLLLPLSSLLPLPFSLSLSMPLPLLLALPLLLPLSLSFTPGRFKEKWGLQQEPKGYDMTKSWLRMLQETYYAMAFVIPFCIQVRILIMVAFRLVQIIGNNTI